MAMLMICDEKTLTKMDPTRVFAGADPTTGIPIPDDWASPGAQFRAGELGHLCQVYIASSIQASMRVHALFSVHTMPHRILLSRDLTRCRYKPPESCLGALTCTPHRPFSPRRAFTPRGSYMACGSCMARALFRSHLVASTPRGSCMACGSCMARALFAPRESCTACGSCMACAMFAPRESCMGSFTLRFAGCS